MLWYKIENHLQMFKVDAKIVPVTAFNPTIGNIIAVIVKSLNETLIKNGVQQL